jgi:hypothetical protein
LLAQTLVQFSDVESGVVQVCVNHNKLIARFDFRGSVPFSQLGNA